MRYPSRLLFSALLAGATATVIGCGGASVDASHFPPFAQPIAIRPLPGAESMQFTYSGITTRQRLVIRDAATWADVWPQIAGSVQPLPPAPAVDFASDLVIVAAMGTRRTGGYSISIDEVRVASEDAWISVTETSPGSGCIVTQALTAPVAVAVMTRFAGRARFLEHRSVRVCQ